MSYLRDNGSIMADDRSLFIKKKEPAPTKAEEQNDKGGESVEVAVHED